MVPIPPNKARISGTIEALLGLEGDDLKPRISFKVEASVNLNDEKGNPLRNYFNGLIGQTIPMYILSAEYNLLKKGDKIELEAQASGVITFKYHGFGVTKKE